jgi:molybdate transport system ATP-binding protein
MKLYVLAASAAALALTAGAAAAATSTGSGKYAEPKQPIAYSKLDAYLKATPRQRAKGDWSLDQTAANNAATGTAANASATAPQTDMTHYTSPPAASAGPDVNAGTSAAPPAATPAAPDASDAAPAAPPAPDAAPATPPAPNS